MAKKILIVLGSIVVLFIGALLVAPLFISLDDLRPRIEEEAGKHVRGKVQLGKMSLAFFPSVKVGIDDVRLIAPGFENDPVAVIKEVEVRMSLLSLLTSPSADVAVEGAAIRLVDKGAESNLDAFLLPPEAAPSPEAAAAQAAPAVGQTLATLPGFVSSRILAARFGFRLEDASVEIVSLATPTGSKAAPSDRIVVRDIDVKLSDIGLAVPMKLEASLSPDVAMGDLKVGGKVTSSGVITFNPKESDNEVVLQVAVNMNDLELAFGALFGKDKGQELGAGLEGTVLQGKTLRADLSKLELKLGALAALGKLQVENGQDPALATINLDLAAPNVEIAPFGALVPMVKQYKLGGQVDFRMNAQGPALDPKLDILVALKGVRGSTPELQKPLTDLNGRIQVAGTAKNPLVTIAPMSMRIGASDLSVNAKTRGLDPIVADFSLDSKKLDVDELLGLEAIVVGAPVKKDGKGAPVKTTEADPNAPLDQSLQALAPVVEEALKNPMLDQLRVQGAMNVGEIKALGASFTQAKVKLSYANRALNVSQASLNAYKGALNAKMGLGLKPAALSYDVDADLKGVDLGSVLATHAPGWKKELSGTMSGNFKLNGQGLRKEQLEKHLRGGLNGDIANGHLNLPLNKVVAVVGDKLPSQIVGKVSDESAKYAFDGVFKKMKLASVIKGRKVELKTLDVQYDSSQSKVGILSFKATGEVDFDRRINLDGVVFVSGGLIPVKELQDKSGNVEIPLRLTGTMSDPKPDIGYTSKILAERAAKGALQGQVKKLTPKVKEKLEEEIKKKAPKELQKKASDALKKLFK